MSKRRKLGASTPKGPSAGSPEREWVHREIRVERTGTPPVLLEKGPTIAHFAETYYSSAEGEPHVFLAASTEDDVDRLVRLTAQRFPGAHMESVPSACPIERHSSWSHHLEYAPAAHGESCQLETTVPDPAAYLVDLLDRLRAEGKEFVVITQLQTIPRRHGRETRYSVMGRVAIDGPAAQEVVEQGILPWLATFQCTTCAEPWFEVDMLEPDDYAIELPSDGGDGEPGSGHGPEALHRPVLLPAAASASPPFFNMVRDALLIASSGSEEVGVEVIGAQGSLRMVAFGSERTLRKVEWLLRSARPNDSVSLAPEVIPCPYLRSVTKAKANDGPSSNGADPGQASGEGERSQDEHMAFGRDYPILVQEVLNLAHDEAERRGFHLIVSFLQDEVAMKVYETYCTEVSSGQRTAPVPKPADPVADSRAVATLVRREAAERGLTVLLLNLEEGDRGTGEVPPVHCFGDRKLVREYLDRAEKVEGHPVVQMDYTQLYPWPTEEQG